jgi:aerobic carbon-monoxide dehydrogenase medium subunit
VKPAPFTYRRAGSAAEAVAELAEHGDDARVLAGGQSLIALMNLRLATPERLVDVRGAGDLRRLERANGHVEIGAAVRQAEAEDARLVQAAVPLLHEALDHVAHREIRNAGTVCGSVAHGDAAAEIPAVAVALDAEMVALSRRGARTIPARDFFRSQFETSLDPDELLTAVRFPVDPPGTGTAFLEIAPRKGDYALVGVAARLRVGDGRIAAAALAFLGVDARPVRSAAAEQALAGAAPGDDAFAEAGRAAADELEPGSDVHADAEYRRRVAGVLTRRALRIAADRIAGEQA